MGSRKPPRLAYRPPASELPGAQTYVNQTNKENLPPNTDKSPQDNYDSRQKGPSAPENKQQALPITPKHKKKRDQRPPISDTGGGGGSTTRPQFNVPPHSDDAEGGRPIHKEKVRTKSQPGEDYGHPHMDQGYRLHQRRPGVVATEAEDVEAGYQDGKFPVQRQRKQRGQAKKYYRIKDKKPDRKLPKRRKSRIKWKTERRKGTTKRYKRNSRKFPRRFVRFRGGGVATNAERAQKWREKGNPTQYEEYEKDRQEQRKKDRKQEGETKLQTKKAGLTDLPLLTFYDYGGEAAVQEVDLETETVVLIINDEIYDVPFDFLVDEIEDEEVFDTLFGYIDELITLSQEYDFEVDDDPQDLTVDDMAQALKEAFYRDQKRPDRLPQTWQKDRSKGTPDGEDTNAQAYEGGPTWVVPMSSRPGLIEERENQTPTDKIQQPAVTNNPGSAKVIPSGYGFVNKVASRHMDRVAARIAEIWDATDQGIHQRSDGLQVKLKRTVPKHAYWLFQVQGKTGSYLIRLQAQRRGNTVDINKLNVRMSCSCDFWRWQGPEHWAKAGGYLYGKPRGTASKPDAKDPEGNHRVCKHVLAVLRRAKKNYKVRPKSRFIQKQGSAEAELRYLSDSLAMGRVSVSYCEFDRMVARVTARFGQEKA